jgi:hypothetical protein
VDEELAASTDSVFITVSPSGSVFISTIWIVEAFVVAEAFVDNGSASSFAASPEFGLMLSEIVTVGIGPDAVERVDMSFDPDEGLVVFRDFLWRRVVTRVDVEISIND